MHSVRASSYRILIVMGVVALVGGLVLASLVTLWPTDEGEDVSPVLHDDRPWQLAYYEGGPFYNYPQYLTALVDGLIALGWMEPIALPTLDPADDAHALWQFLAENAQSAYLTFLPEAFWSANWDDTQRTANRAAAIDRLAHGGDIDLIIAMGTWAGLDLANNDHAVPTLVMSTSNPIEAGIIRSATDSGYDHVHAWCDPERYVRQARLFYEIARFKRLGVIYEDTPDGWTYANLNELTQVAHEQHFELVLCAAPDIGVSEAEALQGVQQCLAELAPKIDAMWIGNAHRGFKTQAMPDLLAPLFKYNVASWSVSGSVQVARGVLLSISRRDLSGLGLWTARVVAQIFHGVKPRAIDQVYVMTSTIDINLETAHRIGFLLPEGLLQVADERYEAIEGEAG